MRRCVSNTHRKSQDNFLWTEGRCNRSVHLRDRLNLFQPRTDSNPLSPLCRLILTRFTERRNRFDVSHASSQSINKCHRGCDYRPIVSGKGKHPTLLLFFAKHELGRFSPLRCLARSGFPTVAVAAPILRGTRMLALAVELLWQPWKTCLPLQSQLWPFPLLLPPASFPISFPFLSRFAIIANAA